MRRATIPGPLSPDDPFVETFDLSDRQVWFGVSVIDWERRRKGSPRASCELRVVPTSTGIIVMARPSIVQDISFADIRNIEFQPKGFSGFVALEARNHARQWTPLKWSTKRPVARALVELLTELSTQRGAG